MAGANCRVPVSTRTRPSSVSNAVQPENCEANQVRGATSTGPPLQKNLSSSGLLPRMLTNFDGGLSAMSAPYLFVRGHANREADERNSHHPTEAARGPPPACGRALGVLQRGRDERRRQGARAGKR